MPRFAVLVFPGSNCEEDVKSALEDVLGEPTDLVWHKETSLAGYDAAILPCGFAHVDYLRPGALARFSPVMDPVREMAERGKPVIGICNGFQMLQEASLLPGAMLRNRTLTAYLLTRLVEAPLYFQFAGGFFLIVPSRSRTSIATMPLPPRPVIRYS